MRWQKTQPIRLSRMLVMRGLVPVNRGRRVRLSCLGPVADQGLDPNMDSWPLDQAAIVNILNSGDYSQMKWSGNYTEDSEAISAAQNVRGFHTLEFLLFKDGQARTVD